MDAICETSQLAGQSIPELLCLDNPQFILEQNHESVPSTSYTLWLNP